MLAATYPKTCALCGDRDATTSTTWERADGRVIVVAACGRCVDDEVEAPVLDQARDESLSLAARAVLVARSRPGLVLREIGAYLGVDVSSVRLASVAEGLRRGVVVGVLRVESEQRRAGRLYGRRYYPTAAAWSPTKARRAA